MIGLLRKDLYVADRSSRLLLFLALVFSAAPSFGSTLGSTYALMMAFMIPINSIAYDERCKWDRYAAMLPYRAGQLVWSKYVLSFLYTLLGEAIIFCGALIRNVLKPGSVDWSDTLATGGMTAIVMLLVVALALPAIYRFGSEKGRLVMLLMVGAGVGAAVALAGVLAMDVQLPPLPPVPVLAAVGVVVVVGAVLASFRLSVHFYRKRQNGAYD